MADYTSRGTVAEHDESKLPKWVRTELATLRMRVAEWREQALTGPDDSTVFEGITYNDRKPLGTDPRITFEGEGWHAIQVYRAKHGEDGIEVYSNGGQLSIEPVASNVVKVSITDG